MTTSTSTLDLTITGMSCDNCVRHVTEALRGADGVVDATVDLPAGRAKVKYDSMRTDAERLIAAVGRAGYRAAVA